MAFRAVVFCVLTFAVCQGVSVPGLTRWKFLESIFFTRPGLRAPSSASKSCWLCSSSTIPPQISSESISELTTPHIKSNDQDPQSSLSTHIPLRRTPSGLVEVDVFINSFRKTFVIVSARRRPLDTQLFCSLQTVCKNTTVNSTAPFCQYGIAATSNRDALLNHCLKELGAPPCLNGTTKFRDCDVAVVSMSIGNTSFASSNYTLRLNASIPDKFVGIDGQLNFNTYNWRDYPTQNVWNQRIVSDFAGIALMSFNRSGEGYLRLGSSWLGDIQSINWSINSPVPSPKMIIHPFFHMSTCNVNLFSNFSSHWPAAVVTEYPCLVLPPQFFEMIKAWAPLICPSTDQISKCVSNDTAGTCAFHCTSPTTAECARCCHRCRVEAENVQSLPSLQYQLSENGPLLSLSLQSLLDQDNTLCIEAKSWSQENYIDMASQTIDIGTLVMEYPSEFVWNFVTHQMTVLQPQVEQSDESADMCSRVKDCLGQQQYYAPMNECLDPVCSDFAFQTIDDDVKECRLTVGFQATIILLLLMFAGAELLIYELYRRLTSQVLDSVPSI